MGKDVSLGPSGKIKTCARRQEVKAGFCQLQTPLALQHGHQAIAYLMEIEHVLGGVFQLGFRKLCRPPVRALLLLGELDTHDLAGDVLQPVPVGIGAHQLGSDLGTEDRAQRDTQIALDHGHVKAGKMKDFFHLCVGQKRFQPRAVIGVTIELYQMGLAITRRKLDKAQAVTHERQAQRLGIHRNPVSQIQPVGQIALVKMYRHAVRPCAVIMDGAVYGPSAPCPSMKRVSYPCWDVRPEVEPSVRRGYFVVVMINSIFLAGAILTASGQDASAQSGSGFLAASDDADRRAFVGLRAGTLGVGLEGGYRLNDYFQIRAHAAGLVYSDDQTVADISSDFSLRLASIGGGIDFFPFRRVFYVTAGARYNFNKAVFNAQAASDYQIGDNVYTAAEVGQLSGEARFAPNAWFADAGLAGRPWNGQVELAFEAGVYRQGVPSVSYEVTGLLANDPAFRADLDREAERARQDLDKYDSFPLIALNIRYRF